MADILTMNRALREAGEKIKAILIELEVEHDVIITELALHGIDVTAIEDTAHRNLRRVSISARNADRPGQGWS